MGTMSRKYIDDRVSAARKEQVTILRQIKIQHTLLMRVDRED